MAARDQALFLETFLSLRKALKRKAYESDSDSSIDDQTTNRGNKLKKRAIYVHQGQLAPPTGPSVYKETVEHGGYQRDIIHRNPPLVDEDGYDVETDDDEEHVQEVVAAVAEFNPYASIRLENLLAPLTSVSELATHPTLSRPFTSKALTELTEQGRNWMQRENKALWKVRPLLTKLCGDLTWVPCDMMVTPNDLEYFEDDFTAPYPPRTANGSAVGDAQKALMLRLNGDDRSVHHQGASDRGDDKGSETAGSKADRRATVGRQVSEVAAGAKEEVAGETAGSKSPENPDGDTAGVKEPIASESKSAQRDRAGDSQAPDEQSNGTGKGAEGRAKDAEKEVDSATDGTSTAMMVVDKDRLTEHSEGLAKDLLNATASVANGSRAVSTTPGLYDEDYIHPLFLAPPAAHPERDLRLPEMEAEEVRRLLQLWVQKQEEVSRGSRRLYEGLMRANRLRKTVLRWSKAEAHCGANRDMSDGEDWYDKDEWGLTEELKKGHDEEEEDQQQTHKKTRNRK